MHLFKSIMCSDDIYTVLTLFSPLCRLCKKHKLDSMLKIRIRKPQISVRRDENIERFVVGGVGGKEGICSK